MFESFSFSVIGQSHVEKGKVCQDFALNRVYENYGIAIVADGHGGRRHFRSDVGSLLAAEAASSTVSGFYADPETFEESFLADPQKVIKKMEKHIISRWNQAIGAHYRLNPVTEEELAPLTEEMKEELKMESIYGTTLIVAVMGRKFTFGIQIGDGSLVMIDENAVASMPIEDDESCPANLTASLCNSNAVEMFRSFFTTEPVVAVYASTDGLFTSFSSEYDFLDYHTIVTSQLENLENSITAVERNLTKRTYFGTQDDISLSVVFHDAMLAEKMQELKINVENNKRKAEMRKAEKLAKIQKQKVRNAMLTSQQPEMPSL